MRLTQRMTQHLRSLFHRNTVERELDQELRFHVERQVRENISAGMTLEEARHAALKDFGGVEQFKEECRDERRVNLIETLLQDARYALRTLIKNPGFAFFTAAILAVGIAANTAIFSIADTVLLRPLPYRDASRLVMIWDDATSYGFPRDTPAPGNFADWRSRNEVFEDVAAASFGGSFNLTGDGRPEEITGRGVTANLFSVLGASPSLGRDFRVEDDVPGAAGVVILSHGLWIRRFAGDAAVIGKEIVLNNKKYNVVGVMPRGFQFPDREVQLWVPAQFTKETLANHGSHFLEVVARLKPGVSLQRANANLTAIAQKLADEFPDSNAQVGAFAVPLREELAGDLRLAILVLLGAVCFVLLIACANVANMLLARATGRKRELAMRLALGATRGRIVAQLLTESILLALLAGAAGLLLSLSGTQFLSHLIPQGFSPLVGTGIDRRVLLFTIAVSVTTGILFGILPALRISRLNLVGSLKQGGGQSGVGSGGQRLRDMLVVAEVALAIVLLTGASLMIRSFENLTHLDPGFRPDHVLVMRTSLPRPKYGDFVQRTSFYTQVLSRVNSIPGAIAAGYTTWVPLTNPGGATGITIEGRPQPGPGQTLVPNARIISSDYIRAVGMKFIEGRLFGRQDGSQTPLVALINQTMARNYWPGEDPVGKRFKKGSYQEASPWITIAGIVGDVHQAGLDLPARPEMYLPYQQQEFFSPDWLAVRTSGDPMHLAETIRQEIWAVDKEQPVAGMTLLEDLVDENLAPRRIQASLLGGFAGLALLLATLGIYAVLSFAVTQRTQEIGIRVALGAHRSDVLRMVLSQGLKLFMVGAGLGLVAALALSRTLAHLLYGLSVTDPISFVAVIFLLGGVTLLACYIPARRATRVDPLVALRYE
ncbi:MAG TPA: ABC transporter permease [Candidatus Acidoferrum sp.]|nr:ABC transporter permease [Candidatus Acidoferrum sp.]